MSLTGKQTQIKNRLKIHSHVKLLDTLRELSTLGFINMHNGIPCKLWTGIIIRHMSFI